MYSIVLHVLLCVLLRGLFEKDKLVFAFMLCVDIMKTAGTIQLEEWNYFLRGVAGMDRVSFYPN